MNSSPLIIFTVSLIAILNPIGNSAIFLSLAGSRPRSEQIHISITCALTVAIVLLLSIWFGSEILHFFGLSVASIQGAGGLIVLLIGLSMVQGATNPPQLTNGQESVTPSIGVVPLGIPLFTGPGAIALIIAQTQYADWQYRLISSGISLAIAVFVFLVLLASPALGRILRESGMKVVTRIMGLILTAIAFQMLAAALIQLLPGLA